MNGILFIALVGATMLVLTVTYLLGYKKGEATGLAQGWLDRYAEEQNELARRRDREGKFCKRATVPQNPVMRDVA